MLLFSWLYSWSLKGISYIIICQLWLCTCIAWKSRGRDFRWCKVRICISGCEAPAEREARERAKWNKHSPLVILKCSSCLHLFYEFYLNLHQILKKQSISMHINLVQRNKAHGVLKHVSSCTCCVSSVVLSSTFWFLRPHSVSINFRKIKILCFSDSVLQMNTNKLPIALIYTQQ